jgi:hypothetical protein
MSGWGQSRRFKQGADTSANPPNRRSGRQGGIGEKGQNRSFAAMKRCQRAWRGLRANPNGPHYARRTRTAEEHHVRKDYHCGRRCYGSHFSSARFRQGAHKSGPGDIPRLRGGNEIITHRTACAAQRCCPNLDPSRCWGSMAARPAPTLTRGSASNSGGMVWVPAREAAVLGAGCNRAIGALRVIAPAPLSTRPRRAAAGRSSKSSAWHRGVRSRRRHTDDARAILALKGSDRMAFCAFHILRA